MSFSTCLCYMGSFIGIFAGIFNGLSLSYSNESDIYLIMYILMAIGGFISLLGSFIINSDKESAWKIIILGSIIGGINILTLAGGIQLRKETVYFDDFVGSSNFSSNNSNGASSEDFNGDSNSLYY